MTKSEWKETSCLYLGCSTSYKKIYGFDIIFCICTACYPISITLFFSIFQRRLNKKIIITKDIYQYYGISTDELSRSDAISYIYKIVDDLYDTPEVQFACQL